MSADNKTPWWFYPLAEGARNLVGNGRCPNSVLLKNLRLHTDSAARRLPR